jgi:hypothetical protein
MPVKRRGVFELLPGLGAVPGGVSSKDDFAHTINRFLKDDENQSVYHRNKTHDKDEPILAIIHPVNEKSFENTI